MTVRLKSTVIVIVITFIFLIVAAERNPLVGRRQKKISTYAKDIDTPREPGSPHAIICDHAFPSLPLPSIPPSRVREAQHSETVKETFS
jgi:hypothetical protein